MADSRWLRLNIDWDDSLWLFALSPESQLAWIKLLCHVKRDGRAGKVKALAPLIASRKWGLGEEAVVKLLQAAQIHGAIESDGSTWTIVKWNHYQDSDLTATERQRKKRERDRQNQEKDHGMSRRDNRDNENLLEVLDGDGESQVQAQNSIIEPEGSHRMSRRDNRNACRVTLTETLTETEQQQVVVSDDDLKIGISVLAILRENPGMWRADDNPQWIAEVISENPGHDLDQWIKTARGCRDWCSEWASMKQNHTKSHPPSTILREYLSKQSEHKPEKKNGKFASTDDDLEPLDPRVRVN